MEEITDRAVSTMNRINRVVIKNFKSLLDVTINFPERSPILFLIGLNGAGKSTILQAFDFIGELMRGSVSDWLRRRNWSASDITSKVHSSRRRILVDISIFGRVDSTNFEWHCTYNPASSIMRCTSEKLIVGEETCLTLKEGKLVYSGNDMSINFSYTGSILSQMNDKTLERSREVKSIRDIISTIHSFDLLSPRNIRVSSRKSFTIGMSGESLSGYIANLSNEKMASLIKKMKNFYPWIHDCTIKHLQYGWKQLIIRERIREYYNPSTNSPRTFVALRPSQHVNDGTLRLLAIVSALLGDDSMILFDEIENGFNPHVIKKLIEMLCSSTSQIIATTHSPEVLQYIPDEFSQDSVKLIYRNNDGTTGVVNFLTLEEIKDKLRFLGPGEAFLDIDLDELVQGLADDAPSQDRRG